jgi:hypothetical protein
VAHAGSDPRLAQVAALMHGYRVAFFWGAVLLAAALVVALVFINAKKDDLPTDAALAGVAPA